MILAPIISISAMRRPFFPRSDGQHFKAVRGPSIYPAVPHNCSIVENYRSNISPAEFFNFSFLYLFLTLRSISQIAQCQPASELSMNRSSIAHRNINKNRSNSHNYNKRGTRSPKTTSTRPSTFVKHSRRRILIAFTMSERPERRRWLSCSGICGRRLGDDSFSRS